MVPIENDNRNYNELEHYSEVRRAELIKLFKEEINVLIEYEKLICYGTSILGEIPPKDITDKSIRDLLADVFDFLYISRKIILDGYATVAFPLLRRSYECISLIHYFVLSPGKAAGWDSGKEIENKEVRIFLDSHPFGESKENLKELYAYFSDGAHPNRDFIPFRFLGDENKFVLGGIGMPHPLIVANYINHMFKLWIWCGALISYYYKEPFGAKTATYFASDMKLHTRAHEVFKKLCEVINRLIDERDAKDKA